MKHPDFWRRVCSSLVLAGLALGFLRACHLLPWPWRWVLLPFAVLGTMGLIYVFFVLVGASLVELTSARNRRRNRNRNSYYP